MANGFNEREALRRVGEALSRVQWRRWAPWLVVAVVGIVGAYSSAYEVKEGGVAVVKRFGAVVGKPRKPGLHFKWPFGIDRVEFVPTDRVLKAEFGFRTVEVGKKTEFRRTDADRMQSLMLTGDLNVIDIQWVVQYRVKNPDAWLHHVRSPEETVRDVSEAVMRQIVGNRYGQEVLTEGGPKLAADCKAKMQDVLDSYGMPGRGEAAEVESAEPPPRVGEFGAGVHIGSVELRNVTLPKEVMQAFNAVNQARQEKEKLIKQAAQEAVRMREEARGEAAQITADAEAYKSERVNRAKGEAARFKALYREYKKAPSLTRRRLYLEMIDKVLPKAGDIYVVEGSQRQPLPLLNLGPGGKGLSPRKQSATEKKEVAR